MQVLSMYARVTHTKTKVEDLDEMVNMFQESIFPEMQHLKGFIATTYMVNRETGEILCIVTFRSKEDEEASMKSGYFHNQIKKLESLVLVPVQRQVYEVVISTDTQS